MDLDTFGEIMDGIILKSHCQMLIEIPEGTLDAEVQTNMPGGPVTELYLLLAAIPSIVQRLVKTAGGFRSPETLADAICDLLREAILEALEETEDD